MMKQICLAAAVCVFAGYAASVPQAVTVIQGGGYFPVLVRLRSGELLTVFRSGAAHVGVKGRLDLAMSKDGGRTWSDPWTAIDGPEDDRNPALGQLRDGTLLLAYSVAKNYNESGLNFKGSRKDRVFDGVYVMRSGDKGRTWSKPERSETIHEFYDGQGVVSPYGKMLQLRDGSVLMAVYFEFFDERGFQSYLYRSKDGGKTWGDGSLIAAGYNETGIAMLPNGHLLAAMRSGKGGHLAISRSVDAGRSWSSPEQVTADLEHPGDLIVLRDSRVLLSFGERNEPRGVHALLSRDEGKTWDKTAGITLANDAPNIDCGYPSSVQLPTGEIVSIYYLVEDAKNTPASAKAKAILWHAPKP